MCSCFFIFIYLMPKKTPTPIYNNINVLQSTVFNLPGVKALIYNTQQRLNAGHTLESDFTRIMFLIMRSFEYKDNNNLIPHWVVRFIPEVWTEDQYNGRRRCDGLLYRLNNLEGSRGYGTHDNKILFEGKNHTAVSWWVLLNTQLWNMADSFKNQSSTGNLWVIGLIGF